MMQDSSFEPLTRILNGRDIAKHVIACAWPYKVAATSILLNACALCSSKTLIVVSSEAVTKSFAGSETIAQVSGAE